MDEPTELASLRKRLEEEEAAYASLLASIDALAAFPLPYEKRPDLPAQMAALNRACAPADRPAGGGIGGAFRQRTWDAVAPGFEHQRQFNSLLVQVLNGFVDESAKLYAHLRELAAVTLRHTQRILPVMDARDRMATALATTRAELILEAFDRRQETLGRRMEGLLALRARVTALGEETSALRRGLESGPPPPPVAAAAQQAADDSTYAAFEQCYRGSREEIRGRLADYVPMFEGLAPVLDLGCGRGEFLELLKAAGIAGRGVESNLHVVQDDVARGLDVVHGDLLTFLHATADQSVGGVFAAQVAEHLPPPVLQRTLQQAFRVLRPGGLMILETVNPRSVIGLLEVFNRDLTHERPLHPDTLSFLASAAGFTDVRIELRSPVDAAARGGGAQREHGAFERPPVRPAGVRAPRPPVTRLAFFSPLPPAPTGIADYTIDVLHALGARYEVDVIHDQETVEKERLPAGVNAVRAGAWDAARYDLPVYQLGNGMAHEYQYHLLARHPGLLVLHDLVLHHSRAKMFLESPEARAYAADPAREDLRAAALLRIDVYREELEQAYPGRGGRLADAQLGTIGQLLPYAYPLFRGPVEASRLTACHNDFMVDAVRDEVPQARVTRIPMPMTRVAVDPGAVEALRHRLGFAPDDFVVASFGLLTREKRIETVARAVARAADSVPNVRLLLVGPSPDPRALGGMLKRVGCASRAIVAGRVAFETLAVHIEAADLVAHLRYPTARETSAALLRVLAQGRPTVISDLEHLADIPEDAVVRAAVDDEEGEVLRAILRLAEDPKRRDRLGAAAARFIAASHSPAHCAEAYADAIATTCSL